MSARASTVVACDAGRCVELERSGCYEMCVQGVQLGNAECKCSAEGQAHVHMLEGAGDLRSRRGGHDGAVRSGVA